MFLIFLSATFCKIFDLTINTTACQILKYSGIFTAIFTVVVSSLSVAALSVERYLTCIHSFRSHEILGESRVRYSSMLVWIIGTVLAAFETINRKYSKLPPVHAKSMVPIGDSFMIIFITLSFLLL